MLEQRSLSDIIQEKIPLGAMNARGWYEVRCAVCGDYQVRGGFRFDGHSTGYWCWNCGTKFRYEEGSGKLSRAARQVLEAFGLTKDDLVGVRSALLAQVKPQETSISLEELRKVKLFTPEVELPEKSFPLGTDHSDELQAPLIEYLQRRRIDPLRVRAHFSLSPRYLRRVIIPFFRDGKIIYWQARTIDDVKPRYLNATVSKEAVLYGYDELYRWNTTPLFVMEGVFDAISINGLCILGSALNEAKLEVLRRCRRRLIFVIDRDKTGSSLGQAALENGWEISFVDERARDVNDSVQQFGLPYTIYSLLRNATTKPTFSDQSKLKLSMGVLLGKLRGGA